MSEIGHRADEGPSDDASGPGGFGAVARADLRRSRQAVFGTEVHPDAAMFADRVARAVTDGGGEVLRRRPAGAALGPRAGRRMREHGDGVHAEATTDPGPLQLAVEPDDTVAVGISVDFAQETADAPGPRVSPALREAAFGAQLTDLAVGHGTLPPGALGGPEIVPLPSAPALVCDRSDRIVRVNPALLRLTGRRPEDADSGLFGLRLPQLVVGPDDDARLVRADGGLVRVRAVRWELPGRDLRVVVLVELGDSDTIDLDRDAERRWIAELERMARVGTWTYELADATLTRSDTLEELYVSVGIDPRTGAGPGSGPVEGEQVALLCQGLRSGRRTGDHHVELRLPGDVLLSCRADVECADDGTPVRLVGVVRDVSQERVAQDRVRHCGQRFADLMDLTPSGIALLDPTGRVVDVNPALCGLFDVAPEALHGRHAIELCAEPPAGPDRPSGGPELPPWLRQVPVGARHGYRIQAVPLRRGDGTTVWCELAVSATAADDGSWLWIVACTDIGERRRAAELLRSAGTVDELTRLPNRAATLELVDRLLARPGRHRIAVVCGDLDDFQRVNSSLGHEAGDDLLVSLAGRLQRELPVGCTAARLSGDEFVVVCADHSDVGGPDLLARRVADLLRTTVTVHGRPVQITASVGLATPVASGEVRAADLLRFAEVAMHDAKRRQARGGITVATDGVVSTAARALELEAELAATIAAGGLVLDYQPVVGPDGAVLSAEALVRWPHPERGLIAPADFLPVAQRSGLMRELDLWVLRTATREAASWPVQHGGGAAVAVNLAGLLPADPDFLAAVTGIVESSGLAWNRLVLELVETSLVALPPHALAAMAELADRGVRFAVDDFGTGYSSLARLHELPAQTVKVDRAFVSGVGSDPAAFAVARAVVDMARAMGRTTVAEGVETAEQFHVLRDLGVDAFQGWLFSHPLRAAEIRDVLAGGRLAASPAAVGA